MDKYSWYSFWETLDDPLHRYTEGDWLRFYAKELTLYFPEQFSRVLEFGCGNGELYAILKSLFPSYIGIDFSPAMLRAFKQQENAPPLIQADITRLPLLHNNEFDLIFSRNVCQYMDTEMLRLHLQQVRQLLTRNGVYLIANIPDKQLRTFYYMNMLRGDKKAIVWYKSIRKRLAIWLSRHGIDGIGAWYSRYELCELAAMYGLNCRAFSSASYEYRFHAVLKKYE